MIELNATNIKNAVAKAREQKPLVKVLEFGLYAVTNKQTGATYQVECKKVDGRKLASCDCKAGQQARFVCKHIAASLGIHCQLASERQTIIH